VSPSRIADEVQCNSIVNMMMTPAVGGGRCRARIRPRLAGHCFRSAIEPAFSENSAARLVNGSSMNLARCSLSGPEWLRLATKVAVPSLVRPISFRGPSKADQIGLEA
jgi:hypothetical protein